MEKSQTEILLLLQSPNSQERALALTFAGKQHCYAMRSRCMDALEDPDTDVRAMAAWALDRLGSPETVPALINALNDPTFGVRSNAGWALVHMAQRVMLEIVVPDVIEILRFGDSYDARQMAFLVLHHIGGDVSEEAIQLYWRRSQ